jgi:hypothetical protein
VEGDTSESTPETGVATCGSGSTLGSSGLWFSFVGTGDRLLVGVRTGSSAYDSQLVVYQGEDCQNLYCVDSNDNTVLADYESAVAFDSTAGATYYALVHGSFASTGVFDIEVTASVSLNNDDCDGATMLELGVPVSGDTSQSLDELGLSTCGSGSGPGAGGLWYRFEGSGSRLLVGVNATFDSQLGLYTGTCNYLFCMDGNDDAFSDGYQSALELNSIEGETYYALVHGYFSSAGYFEIVLLESMPLDDGNGTDNDNESCEGATTLEIGVKLAGDTATSTSEDFLDVCGRVFGVGGLWYQIIGVGERLLLGVAADFDVQLLLYSGSCDALECIDWNDDDFEYSEYQSAIEFESVAGEMYYALVSGYSASIGMFEIELTTLEPLDGSPSPVPLLDDDPASTPPDADLPGGSNDECNRAMEVEIGEVIPGDTSGTTVDVGLEACGGVSTLGAGGLWYSFLGVGTTVLIGVGAEFDSQILVFSGRCDVLTCIDGNDDNSAGYLYQSALQLDTVAGQAYYVYGK